MRLGKNDDYHCSSVGSVVLAILLLATSLFSISVHLPDGLIAVQPVAADDAAASNSTATPTIISLQPTNSSIAESSASTSDNSTLAITDRTLSNSSTINNSTTVSGNVISTQTSITSITSSITTTLLTTSTNITSQVTATTSSSSTATNSSGKTLNSGQIQLVANGMFETGDFTSWEYGGSASVESTVAFTGSYSAHIGSNDFIQTELPPASAAATDIVSFALYLTDSNSALYLVISLLTGQANAGYNVVYAVTAQPGNPLTLSNSSGSAVYIFSNQPKGQWLKFSRNVLADLASSGLTSAQLTYSEIGIYDQSVALGLSAGEYFDDLSLLVSPQVSTPQSMSGAAFQPLLTVFLLGILAKPKVSGPNP